MLPAPDHPAALREYVRSLSGRSTQVRLAGQADAEFIHSVRLSPTAVANLSATSVDLRDQVRWMQAYEERFEKGSEAYFIIVHGDQDVGTIRLYDYQVAEDSFCCGSWIIRPGAVAAVAPYSLFLAYEAGFGALAFGNLHLDVRQENRSVWRMHEILGMRLVSQDALNRYYRLRADEYPALRDRLLRFAR